MLNSYKNTTLSHFGEKDGEEKLGREKLTRGGEIDQRERKTKPEGREELRVEREDPRKVSPAPFISVLYLYMNTQICYTHMHVHTHTYAQPKSFPAMAGCHESSLDRDF